MKIKNNIGYLNPAIGNSLNLNISRVSCICIKFKIWYNKSIFIKLVIGNSIQFCSLICGNNQGICFQNRVNTFPQTPMKLRSFLLMQDDYMKYLIWVYHTVNDGSTYALCVWIQLGGRGNFLLAKVINSRMLRKTHIKHYDNDEEENSKKIQGLRLSLQWHGQRTMFCRT